VISTPRVPQTVISDSTSLHTPESSLGSPTAINPIYVAQGSPTVEASREIPPQFSNLTPQQILASKFFKPGSLTDSPTPLRGGTLKIASTFDIPTLDPRQLATGGTMVLANFVYEGFVRYDQSIERDPIKPAILPSMAYKWDFTDGGNQLTLNLNAGIHWGNANNPLELGPEITASDYQYTLNAYKDNSALSKFYEFLESVEVQNRYTLKLTFSQPSFGIIPFFASSMGIQFNPFLADKEQLNHAIIGPGPFILDSYENKSQVTLLRNPHYYRNDFRGRSLPYLSSIQFIYAPDRNSRLALLKTSKVQIAELSLSPTEIDAELTTDSNLNISLEIPSGIQNSIALQLDNLNWASKEARRAIALATDGEGISQTIFEGFGMPTDKFEWWYWNDVLPSWEHDLDEMYGQYNNHTNIEKAQMLWDQEGLGDLTMKLTYYPHSTIFTDIVAAVQKDWKQLGITLQPTPLTYSSYFTALRQRTSVDAILATQNPALDISNAVYNRVHSKGSGNREGINDSYIDVLVTQLGHQSGQNIQRSTLQQLRQYLNEQVYWISLPSVAFISGTMFRTTVHGIPNGNHSSFRTFYQGKVLAEVWID